MDCRGKAGQSLSLSGLFGQSLSLFSLFGQSVSLFGLFLVWLQSVGQPSEGCGLPTGGRTVSVIVQFVRCVVAECGRTT